MRHRTLALALAAGLLSGCAGLLPGASETAKPAPPPAPAPAPPAPDPQVVAAQQKLEQERQQLQTDRRQLDRDRQQVQAEQEQLRAERQQTDRGRQQFERDRRQLESERQQLEESLKKQAALQQELDDKLARQRLALMERDAQIKALSQKLDATILEVVRAMAKLRSLESRAEAASTLAEAETAFKALGRDPARERDADLVQAEQLLKLGAQEFRKENYGGVLYLTSQAKNLIKGGQARTTGGQTRPRIEGEVPFSVPLPLRALGKGSVREGPGPNFKVAFVVENGTPLTGQSYKGAWVRVRGDDGRWGWISHTLVGER